MVDDSERAEFLGLLEMSGLSQAALGRALGVAAMTVNRWKGGRNDALPVPRYVIVFLRAYNRLPAGDRAMVLKP